MTMDTREEVVKRLEDAVKDEKKAKVEYVELAAKLNTLGLGYGEVLDISVDESHHEEILERVLRTLRG